MRTDDMLLDPADIVTTRRSAIRVAGVTFLAEARTEGLRLDIQPGLLPFVVEADRGDTEFGVHYEELPEELEADPGREVFDSEGGWRLYERDDRYVLTFALSPPDPGPKPRPSGIAWFDHTFSAGEFFQRPRDVGEARWHEDGTVSVFPWHRPFYELLLLNRIAHLGGMHVHGCGAVVDGGGYLFPGMSGAGKSTLAELWALEQVPVLSDERLVVRREADGMTMYGTPWCSSAGASLPESAPLCGLYFIEHAEENRLERLSPAEAARRLIVRCFPVFYLKAGMEDTLGLVMDIVSRVPAYEFGFVPDASAIEYFRGRVGA